MKRTDLEKNKGAKINSGVNRFGTPGRFGKDAGVPLQRREQGIEPGDQLHAVQPVQQHRQRRQAG